MRAMLLKRDLRLVPCLFFFFFFRKKNEDEDNFAKHATRKFIAGLEGLLKINPACDNKILHFLL